MSKAVLISIQPRWCGKIASGIKTVEIRKSSPKIEPPFKCYIYCTKNPQLQFWAGHRYAYADDHSHNAFDKCGNGKIIGEFSCTEVEEFSANVYTMHLAQTEWMAHSACLPMEELFEYGNKAPHLCGWYISELVIYPEPKELSEFGIERAPQSWCYVEEQR